MPATRELTITAAHPIQSGNVSNILYCDLKAVSGKGMSRNVTTKLDSKRITKSKAARRLHFKTGAVKRTARKFIRLVSCVFPGFHLPLKYLRYSHKIKSITSNDKGMGTNVKSIVHSVIPKKATKHPITKALRTIKNLLLKDNCRDEARNAIISILKDE